MKDLFKALGLSLLILVFMYFLFSLGPGPLATLIEKSFHLWR